MGVRCHLVAVWPLSLLCLAATDDPCVDCLDRWDSTVAAEGRNRHQTLVEAGNDYEITLAPREANADLLVSTDGEWPPEPVGCRSAIGGTGVDRCTFEAHHSGPLFFFVIGGELATRYTLGVAPASPE